MVSDNSGDSSIQKAYYIDGVKQFAATFKKVDGLDESQPLAFCKGTSLSLSGTSVRVMLEKTDITGKTVEKIQRIGFWVTNNDIVLTAAYEQKITLLQARYSIIILALTVFCGCILLKQVKH